MLKLIKNEPKALPGSKKYFECVVLRQIVGKTVKLGSGVFFGTH